MLKHCYLYKTQSPSKLKLSALFRTLLISLDGWILRDGNYPDFVTDHHYTFGLEFHEPHRRLALTDERKKKLIPINNDTYQATGKVLYHHLDKGLLIVDFGVIAYLEASQYGPAVGPGDYLTGRISLSVDYFVCKDYFQFEGDIPPMMYRWQIKEVFINSGPRNNPENFLQRDHDEFVPIYKTDAWHDDDGWSDYLLCCTLVSEEPDEW